MSVPIMPRVWMSHLDADSEPICEGEILPERNRKKHAGCDTQYC